jgi:hypothetical protein
MSAEIIEDMDNLRHMLGAGSDIPKRNWGYRNYFNAGGKDLESMERLVAAGLAERYRPEFWRATEAGMKAIGFTAKQIKKAMEP